MAGFTAAVSHQVTSNDFITDWDEFPISALAAFYFRFFAKPFHPFVGTIWLIAALTCFTTFKPARINIFTATKKAPEQLDIFGSARE